MLLLLTDQSNKPVKTCSKCKACKLLGEFYKSSQSKDGRATKCKQCHIIYCDLKPTRSGTKTCNRCKQSKTYDCFYRNKQRPDTYGVYCKLCAAEDLIERRREADPERWAERQAEKDRIAALHAAGRKECSTCKEAKPFEAFGLSKKKGVTFHRSWCSPCERLYWKARREINPMQGRQSPEKYKAYAHKNKDKIRVRKLRWTKHKLGTDTIFKLKAGLRRRLRHALKNNSKSGSAVKDLGCTIPEFKLYLESLFQPGMTWDNWSTSGWHLDHIIPLSRFDLTDREQLLKACHYTNMQPLWAIDNLKKADKLPGELNTKRSWSQMPEETLMDAA